MIQHVKEIPPPPPRLTMDEYADFMTSNISNRSLEKTMNQKALEERITIAFSLQSDK